MNRVIGGDYEGLKLKKLGNLLYISSAFKSILIDKNHVERYEMADKDTASQFSYGKAVVGNIVFGIIGTVAGIGGKNKKTYQVVICFRDGKKSLIEVNEKYYKIITRELFNVENYDVEANVLKAKKSNLIALTYIVSLIICILIIQVIVPSRNGVKHLNQFGTLFLIGAPIVIAVVLPNYLFKRKR